MQCTDACVFPYPGGDSSLRRMALLARELGFDSLVAAGSAGGEAYGVEIVGMKVPGGSKEGEGQPPHCGTGREGRTITVARAGDYNANRALLRSGKVKVLRGIQCTPRNSFDHILSRIAAEKCIAVDIDMSSLTSGGGPLRQRALQRYADIVRLHWRFEFPVTLSSGACSILGMRSPRDMESLGRLFGLEEDEAERALRTVSQLLSPGRPVEVVG